jgi:quaternary ammonium compound-resistance protein SugE
VLYLFSLPCPHYGGQAGSPTHFGGLVDVAAAAVHLLRKPAARLPAALPRETVEAEPRTTGPRTRVPYPVCDKTAYGEAVMSWFVLVLSGALEAVWATALGKSEGFTRLGPSIVFGVGLVASMAGLAFAMRTLPIGTAYAVWVGIGAVLTVGYAMATGEEAVSALRVLFLAMIVGGVVGLKVLH